MEYSLYILFAFGVLYLIVWAIKAIIRSATHIPTWTGIIISAILGMLPFYLFLCFFGIMGEKRNEPSDDIQSPIGTYAEEMSRRYAYDSPQKNTGWFKYIILAFVVIFLIHLFSNDSEKQEAVTSTETMTSDNVVLDEQIGQTPSVIKKKATASQQEPKRKNPNSEIQPEIKIKQEDNTEVMVNEKSTIELLEEQNHARVVKQAKEVGVSTEGSTLDILERINHASVVKQAKEVGVSTEGSTLDILERINHASVVKQAKEAGVSTEGSTLDILERINRKQLEE